MSLRFLMFSRAFTLTVMGSSSPLGPGFQSSCCGGTCWYWTLGRVTVQKGLIAAAIETWGGGLPLDVTLAYDRLPPPAGLDDATLMAGLAVRGPALALHAGNDGAADGSASFSSRNRSLPMPEMFTPVAASSSAMGTPSMTLTHCRRLSSLRISSKKGAYDASCEMPKSMCLQL